jgi:hypothetical protein
MAVDTQSKRRAAPNVLPFVIPPVPDGTISNVDREQASYLYSGITPGAPAGGNYQPVLGFEQGTWNTVFGGMVVR